MERSKPPERGAVKNFDKQRAGTKRKNKQFYTDEKQRKQSSQIYF